MFIKSLKDFFKNPVLAVPNIIVGIISTLLMVLLFNQNAINELENQKITSAAQITPEISRLLSYYFLFIIIVFFITPYITAWYCILTREAVNQEKPGLIKSFLESRKYYWRILGTITLKILIVLCLLIGFGLAMVPYETTILNNPSSLSGSFFVLWIFIIVLSIFLGVTLAPIEPVLVYDNLKISEAFAAGFKFGLKRFFRLLGSFILVIVVIIVISLILPQKPVIFDYISSIIVLYLAMFVPVYILNLYRGLKGKNETDPLKEGIITGDDYLIDENNTEPHVPDMVDDKDNKIEDNKDNDYII